MKHLLVLFLVGFYTILIQAQMDFITPYEKNNAITATYSECMAFYEKLANQNKNCKWQALGMTDSGQPLHSFVIDMDRDFDPNISRDKGKIVLFINNGIHPGEPEGIDASMMLCRDIIVNGKYVASLKDVVLVVIPVYNVDGCLNRNSYTRANQDGPESYGFRGNDKNLDLNRDFVKCDSRNAQTFNKIFNFWQPEIMVDTHTSNGADYQHVMTLITSQEDKMAPTQRDFVRKSMVPELFKRMKDKGWDLVPYVDSDGPPLDFGINGFMDSGRYSSGYAALHHCIAFMPETHMLKPYKPRVESTYDVLLSFLEYVHDNAPKIKEVHQQAFEDYRNMTIVPLEWEHDKSRFDMIPFMGYQHKYKTSEVTGAQRLYYDRNEPVNKDIPFYNYFKPSLSVEKPFAYIIPQAWHEVIDRLIWNGVELERLASPEKLTVESYYIDDIKSRTAAYEGHFYHREISVSKTTETLNYKEGDYFVPCDQKNIRYIMETLEPQAPDAFMRWGFFDGILMRKEYFSDYVFEDLAAEFLQSNPNVRAELEAKKKADPKFADSPEEILDWVYKLSPWSEPSIKRYPVARISSKIVVKFQH